MRKREFWALMVVAAVSLSACCGGQSKESAATQNRQETAAETENVGTTEAAETEKTTGSGAVQDSETDDGEDWAGRAIEEGKVSSMEELTFPIGKQVSGTFTSRRETLAWRKRRCQFRPYCSEYQPGTDRS